MSQTSYAIDTPAFSYPGQIADNSEVKDITSALAVLAPMIYGTLGVADAANTQGFDNQAVKTPAASADITTVGTPKGFVVCDQARAQDPTNPTNPQYPQNSAVPLMRQGRIALYAETALVDGSNPFIRFTANGALYTGNVRNDADAGKAVQMPAGYAKVIGNTTGAGFAVIELNIP
jgi:hypothetical protein